MVTVAGKCHNRMILFAYFQRINVRVSNLPQTRSTRLLMAQLESTEVCFQVHAPCLYLGEHGSMEMHVGSVRSMNMRPAHGKMLGVQIQQRLKRGVKSAQI